MKQNQFLNTNIVFACLVLGRYIYRVRTRKCDSPFSLHSIPGANPIYLL